MPNHSNLVAQIRSLLAGGNLTRDARLEALAAEYAAACRAASQRLTRCQEFLNKGLRCEALHHAQTSPDLLDALGALEFAEREQWEDVTATYGLASAPRLNPQAAAALNRAFAEQAPLTSLLSRLRKLALEQGPVGERLRVLHELMQRDPLNPLWSESIGDFEKKRLQELEEEIRKAQARLDFIALQNLERELKGAWAFHQPPPSLFAEIDNALKKLAHLNNLKQLDELSRQLRASFGQRDTDKVLALLGRWDEVVQNLLGHVPPTLLQKVKPILLWRSKEIARRQTDQQFQAALDELVLALRSNRSRPVLEEKWAALKPFDRTIPIDIRREYEGILKRREHALARRVRWVAGTGIAVSVVLVALVWLQLARQKSAREFRDKVEVLTAHLDNGRLEAASRYYESLAATETADNMNRQEVVEQKLRLDNLMGEEMIRRGALAKLMRDIESDPTEQQVPAVTIEARRLAKTHEEKSALERILTAREDRLRGEQNQRDRDYEVEFRRIQAVLARAAKDLDAADFQANLREVEQGVARLDILGAQVSGKVARTHAAFLPQVQSLRKQAERIAQADARFVQMTQAFRPEKFVLDDYVGSLQALAETTANPELARDLKAACANQATWKVIIDWNRALAAATPPDPGQFTTLLQAEAKHPDLARIAEHDRFRRFDHEKLFNHLDAVFNEALVRDLWKVKRFDDREAAPNKEFYTSHRLLEETVPPRKPGLKSFQVHLILDYGYDHGTPVAGPRHVVLANSLVQARQSVVAEAVLKLLVKPDVSNPERLVLEIGKLVREETGIHPIAHLKLLKKIIVPACDASPLLAGLLDEHAKALKTLDADLAVPWMDPDDAKASKMAPRAMADLSRFPSFRPLLGRLQETLDEKSRELKRTAAEPVGFLFKSEGIWRLQPIPRLDGAYHLVTPVKNADGSSRWLRLGSLRGRVNLEIPDSNVPQGALVFAQPVTEK